jgi:alpha-beta hydrolase superfamily lysophospholipase
MIASTPLTDAAGYTGPLLAVAGSEDTTVDPSVSATFLATLNSPDETLRIIEGADHSTWSSPRTRPWPRRRFSSPPPGSTPGCDVPGPVGHER